MGRKGEMLMLCSGTLVFEIYTAREALPIPGAAATLTDPETGEKLHFISDVDGRTPPVCLQAPDVDLSLSPNPGAQPYKQYNARIEAEGYIPVTVEGVQLFPGIESVLPVEMQPIPRGREAQEGEQDFEIPPNALEQEREGTPEGPEEGGVAPRILSSVYIPEYITVHLGTPNNTSARNVTVSFPDYIKNVASSEIYPTWPESALRANIYAQMSFALNRIYTEWYRSRGYSFDITNSTAYDQYYVPGRNIFANISNIVDDMLGEYLRRPGTVNPFFAEYCNGTTVTCQGLSQWGTVPLAQNGYTPLNILKRYYGNNIEIDSTNDIRPIESSYPGTALRLGSSSSAVRTIESQLNRIRRNYPSIPAISNVDNNFTSETEAAVKAFQRIFNLTADGVVGRSTWNRISYIYVAVKRLAELDSEGEPLPSERPTLVLREGSTGNYVRLAQYFLRVISNFYDEVRPIEIDGIFGPATKAAVQDFQRRFGLTADGIIGPATWNSLYNVFLGAARDSGLTEDYPGYLISEGSRGDNVWLIQSYLNTISRRYAIPSIAADGIFGPATRQAVIAFQQLFGLTPDGIVGKNTWDRIMMVRLLL